MHSIHHEQRCNVQLIEIPDIESDTSDPADRVDCGEESYPFGSTLGVTRRTWDFTIVIHIRRGA
jgi:hypothetical protein